MNSIGSSSTEGESVNYDSDPILQVEHEGVEYRLDAGKQGTALCISTREPGTWNWSYGGEARWDASSLRCKAFERRTLEQLSRELRQALADAD